MDLYEKKATFNERTPVRVKLDWGPVNEYGDENFNTALSDMLSRDNGQVLYVDLESGHVIVELDRCTIARWESFGFKVNVLNRHIVEHWQIKGITKAEQEAEEKKEAENKALLAMPRETKEVVNRLLNQLGEEIDKLRAENEELLSALKAMVKSIENLDFSVYGNTTYDSIPFQQAEDAIAQAEKE